MHNTMVQCMLMVLLAAIKLIAAEQDPFVQNYTLGDFAQQDRFAILSVPDWNTYKSGAAVGYHLTLRKLGCDIPSFSSVLVKFINAFNGDIVIRGNTPMFVEGSVPKYRTNHLTTSLRSGQSVSIRIPMNEYLAESEGDKLLFSYVIATTEHVTVPLVGSLMVVVETKDRSLCSSARVDFDVLTNTPVIPYDVYNVRTLVLEDPQAIPHIVQAGDSSFPFIGLDWFTTDNGRYGLYLCYKTADGTVQSPVQFRSYEDANMRIMPIGMPFGFIQGVDAQYAPVSIGATFSFQQDHARWVLMQYAQPYSYAFIGLQDAFSTQSMPANGGFLVVDVRRPTLLDRQKQILVV